MANEIIASGELQHVPSNQRWFLSRKVFDQTTNIVAQGIINSDGTASAFTGLTTLTTPGLGWFMNLEADGGDEIEIGIDVSSTFYPFASLRPGMFQILDLHADVESTTALQHVVASGSGPAKLFFAITDR